MPVTVVVGGQFGSEGKGKVAHYWARRTEAKVAVRVGGPNSGHTVIDRTGEPLILRQLPTAAILPGVVCVIGAGSYIKPDLLLWEIERTNLPAEKLLIDPNAFVITQAEENEEKHGPLQRSIGSTQSGTGSAVQRRISRASDVHLVRKYERLKTYVQPVGPILRSHLTASHRVIIEGTQGYGLSLLHSEHYPFVTSRDTTAAAFVSEAGVSPLDVDEIVMVLRAFPIRVSGHSGVLPEEITWEELTKESGSKTGIIEHTSVTKKVRRVARFHPEVVRQAIMVNNPTHIIMNHVDYVDITCRTDELLTMKARLFVEDVESRIGASIDYVGFGPSSIITRKHSRFAYKSA